MMDYFFFIKYFQILVLLNIYLLRIYGICVIRWKENLLFPFVNGLQDLFINISAKEDLDTFHIRDAFL